MICNFCFKFFDVYGSVYEIMTDLGFRIKTNNEVCVSFSLDFNSNEEYIADFYITNGFVSKTNEKLCQSHPIKVLTKTIDNGALYNGPYCMASGFIDENHQIDELKLLSIITCTDDQPNYYGSEFRNNIYYKIRNKFLTQNTI